MRLHLEIKQVRLGSVARHSHLDFKREQITKGRTLWRWGEAQASIVKEQQACMDLLLLA
jgi:hypothetical protein